MRLVLRLYFTEIKVTGGYFSMNTRMVLSFHDHKSMDSINALRGFNRSQASILHHQELGVGQAQNEHMRCRHYQEENGAY